MPRNWIYFVEVMDKRFNEVHREIFLTIEEAYEWAVDEYHRQEPGGYPELMEVVRNELVEHSRFETTELIAETETTEWRMGRKLAD